MLGIISFFTKEAVCPPFVVYLLPLSFRCDYDYRRLDLINLFAVLLV